MKIKKLLRKSILTSFVVASCAANLPAAAAATNSPTLAQQCALGTECPLPGSDGGQAVYTIMPQNGMHYVCEVKSDAKSLKFAVSSGKAFSITQGSGLYNANPSTTVEVDGRFENPDNPNEQGEIRFTKLPLSSDGKVKCYPRP